MINSIGVHIKVNNFARSKAFYLALGFTPVFEYGPNQPVKEDYSGITFQHGSSKIELADGHRAVKPEVFKERVRSSKISLMIEVDSIKNIIDSAAKSKIAPIVPPRHFYWGKLEVVFRDPDGTVLVFTEPYSAKSAKLLKPDLTFASRP